MSRRRTRPAHAVLRHALAWAAAWGAAGAGVVTVVSVFDPDPAIESLPERLGLALMAGVAWGVRFAVLGALVGALFAAAVRLGYRGRRLAEIGPARFALLGAAVGGIGLPLVLQLLNLLSGDGPVAWRLVGDDAALAAALGALAAAGAIRLARRADPRSPADEEPAPGALPAGGLPTPAPPSAAVGRQPQRAEAER